MREIFAALLNILTKAFDTLFNHHQIGQNHLFLHGNIIPYRFRPAQGRGIKESYAMQDRVQRTNMDEGLVTYGTARFAFACDSGNIQVFDVHRGDLLGLLVIGQEIEPRVRDLYHSQAGILVAPALPGFNTTGQRSENRAFAASGQSDNPQFQSTPSFLLFVESTSLEGRCSE